MRKRTSNKNVEVKATFLSSEKTIIYPSMESASAGLGLSINTLRGFKRTGKDYSPKIACHIEFWKNGKRCESKVKGKCTGSTNLPSWGTSIPVHRKGLTIYEVYNEDEYMEFLTLKDVAFFFKITLEEVGSCLEAGTPIERNWFIDECAY